MIFNIIGLIIGLAVLIGGVFYLVKERKDKESVKIYGAVSAVGAVIFIVMLLKTVFAALG